MSHLEWGLLALAAALVLGGLLGGPFWYAAGHRHGREDGGYGDRQPRHRKGDPAPGYLLELPLRAGARGAFPVSEEDLAMLTSPLLPAEFEAHAGETMAVADDPSVTAWTKAMAADMDRYMASLISKTDEQLKGITR